MRGYENTNKKLNNKGFSLIELLVAIALMGILVGLAAYSITVMRAGDTKRASKTMSGEIAAMRSNTLAVAADWQYEIVNDDGTYKLYTYKNGEVHDYTNLGARLKLYYISKEGGAETEIAKDTKLIIKFVQGSGKVGGMYTVSSGDMNVMSDITTASTVTDRKGYCTLKATNATGGGAEDFKLYYETGTVVQD